MIGDARRLYGVHDPTGQAACLEFGNKQAVGTLWQSVVDAVDLTVIDDDACKQFDELLGKSWVEVRQFICQFIAHGLGLVIGDLPARGEFDLSGLLNRKVGPASHPLRMRPAGQHSIERRRRHQQENDAIHNRGMRRRGRAECLEI